MPENKGTEVEDIVQKILSKMFIGDFVVRKLLYKKESGKQKEAADMLVLFGSNLLVYQVKSKREKKKSTEKSKVDFERIDNKIKEAVTQLKSIKKTLAGNLLLSVENSIGVTVPFQSEKFTKIIGLVILDLLGEEEFSESERTTLKNTFLFENEIPIHVFLREDLELIASELDTLPDFINYLNKREVFYTKNILNQSTIERDFLAFFKLSPDLVNEVILGKFDHLLISPGTWSDYQQNYKEKIIERNEQNKSSYLVDEIISWLHSSIGYDHEFSKNLVSRNDLPQSSVENYFSAVTELAGLNRLERRAVGERLFHVMKKADASVNGPISVWHDKAKMRAILVFSTKESRERRVIALQNLAAMAYCKLGLKKICGIATENLSANGHSYDCIFMEDLSIENRNELIERAASLFNNGDSVHYSEYGTPVKKKDEGDVS